MATCRSCLLYLCQFKRRYGCLKGMTKNDSVCLLLLNTFEQMQYRKTMQITGLNAFNYLHLWLNQSGNFIGSPADTYIENVEIF